VKLTAKQLRAIQDCTSVEELVSKAATAGLELSEEEAAKFIGLVQDEDEQAQAESSGSCNDDHCNCAICPSCGSNNTVCTNYVDNVRLNEFKCKECGNAGKGWSYR